MYIYHLMDASAAVAAVAWAAESAPALLAPPTAGSTTARMVVVAKSCCSRTNATYLGSFSPCAMPCQEALSLMARASACPPHGIWRAAADPAWSMHAGSWHEHAISFRRAAPVRTGSHDILDILRLLPVEQVSQEGHEAVVVHVSLGAQPWPARASAWRLTAPSCSRARTLQVVHVGQRKHKLELFSESCILHDKVCGRHCGQDCGCECTHGRDGALRCVRCAAVATTTCRNAHCTAAPRCAAPSQPCPRCCWSG